MGIEICYDRNRDFVFRKIVDEMILVPVHSDVADMNCIYSLNEMGAFIWERLDRPKTPKELEQEILNEFSVTPEIAGVDLENFLAEMLAIGALKKVM